MFVINIKKRNNIDTLVSFSSNSSYTGDHMVRKDAKSHKTIKCITVFLWFALHETALPHVTQKMKIVLHYNLLKSIILTTEACKTIM